MSPSTEATSGSGGGASLPFSSLEQVLKTAKPDWTVRDVRSVKAKLARVGILQTPGLLEAINYGVLNGLLENAQEKTFFPETLKAMHHAAKQDAGRRLAAKEAAAPLKKASTCGAAAGRQAESVEPGQDSEDATNQRTLNEASARARRSGFTRPLRQPLLQSPGTKEQPTRSFAAGTASRSRDSEDDHPFGSLGEFARGLFHVRTSSEADRRSPEPEEEEEDEEYDAGLAWADAVCDEFRRSAKYAGRKAQKVKAGQAGGSEEATRREVQELCAGVQKKVAEAAKAREARAKGREDHGGGAAATSMAAGGTSVPPAVSSSSLGGEKPQQQPSFQETLRRGAAQKTAAGAGGGGNFARHVYEEYLQRSAETAERKRAAGAGAARPMRSPNRPAIPAGAAEAAGKTKLSRPGLFFSGSSRPTNIPPSTGGGVATSRSDRTKAAPFLSIGPSSFQPTVPPWDEKDAAPSCDRARQGGFSFGGGWVGAGAAHPPGGSARTAGSGPWNVGCEVGAAALGVPAAVASEIEEELKSCWNKGEVERRAVVRKLQRQWHPDKHPPESRDLANKAFQYLETRRAGLE